MMIMIEYIIYSVSGFFCKVSDVRLLIALSGGCRGSVGFPSARGMMIVQVSLDALGGSSLSIIPVSSTQCAQGIGLSLYKPIQ